MGQNATIFFASRSKQTNTLPCSNAQTKLRAEQSDYKPVTVLPVYQKTDPRYSEPFPELEEDKNPMIDHCSLHCSHTVCKHLRKKSKSSPPCSCNYVAQFKESPD